MPIIVLYIERVLNFTLTITPSTYTYFCGDGGNRTPVQTIFNNISTNNLAVPTGFEPAIFSVTGRHHTPICCGTILPVFPGCQCD